MEVIRSQGENEEEEREEHMLTERSDPTTPIEAASPRDNVLPEIGTPPQVPSAVPDVERTSQSQGKECNVMPHDEQAAVETSVNDNGNDGGQHVSEDGLAETGRVQEKQRNERRIENTGRNADSCGGIHRNDEKGGSAEVPSEQQVRDLGRGPFSTVHSSSAGISATFLQTVQQQWLQSEIQAAAMSAQAAFFRKLFLQICSTHGTSGILGGVISSPSQQGSIDLLQQQQQVTLGSVQNEEGVLNAVTQQAVNLVGPPVFSYDSGQKREDGSCNLHQQTLLGRNGITVGQMSSAQDPVAVVLEMASSLGLKFPSSTQVSPQEEVVNRGARQAINHHKGQA